ncbi:MAG: hypothetical protein ABUS54_02040 [Actinomycetota bacterium]
MRIDRRYRGPDESGNGGYSAGTFAELVDGDAEVTLRSPPPLDRELRVDGLDVYDGETLVAQVRPVTVELELPLPPAHVEAGEPDPGHPFPNCFVCGPARSDGLRLQPRQYGALVAAPWRPQEIRRELVWAALDCPGAFAVDPALSRGASVLGRIAVHVEALPEAGDELVIVGWDLGGGDARRSYAGTALFRGESALAWARATWFSIG